MRSTGLVALAGLFLGAQAGAAEDSHRANVSVFLKGGIGDFTGDLGVLTISGPVWGLTVDVQPLKVLGIEIAYDGSRNPLHVSTTGSGALLRNGGTAMLKLGPPLFDLIKPWAGAGLGATQVTVLGDQSALFNNSFTEEVPLALGLEFNTRSVTAGIRYTYRFLLSEDIATGFAAPGNFNDFSATLGGRF